MGSVVGDSCVVDLAVAKTEKYASRESGDTVELIERPSGGFSIVMIDGQGSGRAAKTLSLMLSSKAVALVKEGVRDGVVARATHDYLFAFRHGQVSATLDLLSVDLKTPSIVVTRNAEAPMLLRDAEGIRAIGTESGPIGRYRWTKPSVMELPLQEGVRLVLFTDGIPHSGRKQSVPPFDFDELAARVLTEDRPAQEIADHVLEEALLRDRHHPGDDMAVVVLSLRAPQAGTGPVIRRIHAEIPLV